jgi:sortase A
MTDTTNRWVQVAPGRSDAPNGEREPNGERAAEEEPPVTDDVTVEVEDVVAVELEDDVTVEDPPPEKVEATKPARRPIGAATVVRRGLRVFALAALAFVVFAVLLSSLAHARTQVGLQRRFISELGSNAAPVGGAIPTGVPVASIEIRAIGLHETVVEGSRSAQLEKGPGHVLGTPLPGQPGNAVIAGRHTLYGGPFGRLGSLKSGNRINVVTGEGNTTYRVAMVQKLGASDGSFAQNQNDNRLTLFTTASRWNASSRLVVTATLIGNPLPPTVMSHALDADGLGLTGERNSAPNLLVWLELLAGAALLATYAASRWSRTRVWLVFAPVLALLLWLFFESAVRLLPATL